MPKLKKIVKPKKTVAARDLVKQFLVALTELYPHDATSPGLVIAYLPKGEFYASCCRYEGPAGTDKRIISSATGPTLDGALQELFTNWKNGTKRARIFNLAVKRLKAGTLGWTDWEDREEL